MSSASFVLFTFLVICQGVASGILLFYLFSMFHFNNVICEYHVVHCIPLPVPLKGSADERGVVEYPVCCCIIIIAQVDHTINRPLSLSFVDKLL
jgi:hypothetical protein